MYRALPFVVFLSILVFTTGTREVSASRRSKSALRSLLDYLEDNEYLLTPTRNVFGVDDRTPMESTKYPWSAIGKLSTGCTGTLVVSDC
jgi:V8-like Glu-specific endopeptidase